MVIGYNYKCITHNLKSIDKDEQVQVVDVDYASDYIKIRRLRDNQEVYVLLSQFGDYFVYCDSPYKPEKSFSLCECGSDTTYGPNLDSHLHSNWCPVIKVSK